MGHLCLIVQREYNSHKSVIGERHKIQSLHGNGAEAEKHKRQAVVVGDVVMVKQKGVEKLRHQSRATDQVGECQAKNCSIFRASQVMIQNYYNHHSYISQY